MSRTPTRASVTCRDPAQERLVYESMPEETTRAVAIKKREVDIAYLFTGPVAEDIRVTPGFKLVAPVDVKSPGLGEIQIQNVPVTLSRTPAQVRTAAPEMGEHTDDVLREAGYSAEEIAKFRKDEVV